MLEMVVFYPHALLVEGLKNSLDTIVGPHLSF